MYALRKTPMVCVLVLVRVRVGSVSSKLVRMAAICAPWIITVTAMDIVYPTRAIRRIRLACAKTQRMCVLKVFVRSLIARPSIPMACAVKDLVV